MPKGSLPGLEISQGTINPEANQTWFGPDGEIKYGTAIEKAQFDATVGMKGSEQAKKSKGGESKEGEAEPKTGEAAAEKSEEERLQQTLKAAYDSGAPLVVVFGSQSAKDTEKLLGTLEQNMKNGKADFVYADTDKLDPDSELGRTARRSEESGHGLGADGKADLAFTGVYKVELGADGKYHIGNSVATFWGGRPEIAGIMNDQLGYASRDVSAGQGADKVKPAPRADVSPGGQSGSDRNGSEVQPPQTEEERQAAEEKAKAESEQRAKEAAEAERVKQFSEKPYSMDQYKEGWGRCLDRAGMENGPMRDAVDKLGQQILCGKVDGKEIAGLFNQLQGLERGSAAQMLAGVNQELKENGVSIGATVKDGKIESMEMRAENGNVLVRVDQNGNVTATNESSAQENIDQITLRLAKKIEPDACP
ncbi:MAG: hypothetical protein K2Y39_28780 [Candidatus Obscuribacterales bacterium]|nr:hypothetical protein [Candidatus Obscuribacterales bacterium]